MSLKCGIDVSLVLRVVNHLRVHQPITLVHWYLAERVYTLCNTDL